MTSQASLFILSLSYAVLDSFIAYQQSIVKLIVCLELLCITMIFSEIVIREKGHFCPMIFDHHGKIDPVFSPCFSADSDNWIWRTPYPVSRLCILRISFSLPWLYLR